MGLANWLLMEKGTGGEKGKREERREKREERKEKREEGKEKRREERDKKKREGRCSYRWQYNNDSIV